MEGDPSDADISHLLLERRESPFDGEHAEIPAVVSRGADLPIFAESQRRDELVRARRKQRAELSSRGVQTPDISPVAGHQDAVSVPGDTDIPDALRPAVPHLLRLAPHGRDDEAACGGHRRAGDGGDVPQLDGAVVPSAGRDAGPGIVGHAPHVLSLVARQHRQTRPRSVPHAHGAVLGGGEDAVGGECAVPEPSSVSVEAQKRGKTVLEQSGRRRALHDIPERAGAGVAPDDEGTVVRHGQEVATILAPAELEDDACMLTTDVRGVRAC